MKSTRNGFLGNPITITHWRHTTGAWKPLVIAVVVLSLLCASECLLVIWYSQQLVKFRHFRDWQIQRSQQALDANALFDEVGLLDGMAGYVQEYAPTDEELIKEFRVQFSEATKKAQQRKDSNASTPRRTPKSD